MKMNREMFEGKDYPTQWALNPSMYQNMSNDQVDWAALAQQWIKMKETIVPPAPPPPSLSNESSNDGGGEAPMDMDTKEDDVPPAPPAPTISGPDNWNSWSQWGQWNAAAPGGACWEWSGVPPPGVTMGPDGKPMGLPNIPIPSVPPAPSITSRGHSHNSPFPYNSVSSAPPAFNSSVQGYWSADTQNPPPFVKGMRQGPRVPHLRGELMRNRDEKEKTPEEDTSAVLDAAKRRQLPAWIREGLEKMEREKHKAVERERQEMLRKQELEARKIAEDEARAVLNPTKSKFESDSDKEIEPEAEIPGQEEDHANLDASPDIVLRPRKSRFRDAQSPEPRVMVNKESSPVPSAIPNPGRRSREEILQDVMLKVRRSLTEILLEVTNEEISNVCREVWSRSRAKAPAGGTPIASFTNTAPLAQITRKLGLGIYGDSNSESEEEQDTLPPEENDSDNELKETLKRRQAAFKKTEEEIEARILEEEENEQQEDEESHKYDNNTNDTPLDNAEGQELPISRESSPSSSSGGQTPKHQQSSDPRDNHKSRSPSSPSRSPESCSSSSSPSSSSSSSPSSESSRDVKKRRKRKSKSRSRSPSRGRKSRSRSRSRDNRRKDYRSRSSSRKSSLKLSRDRKRRSREDRSRSRSRRRSRSYSRRRSRERRHSRSRSRNRKHYGRSSKRRSRSKSKERRRSRSKSRGHRDGKKSSRRYRD
ncbi:arginine/serine-rich protein PNISR isoform X2 [Fopius arisanus]|nr:PREDICTED: arginine/serine-rich protein PNISR-like isoform X2 [Fopius arisanus]